MREVEALLDAVAHARAAGQTGVTVDVETLDAALALVPRPGDVPDVPVARVPASGGLAALVSAVFDGDGVLTAASAGPAGEDFLAGFEA